MRILVFSWRDPKHPLAGGAEQVMHEHMKGWISAGHEVTLFSSRLKKQSVEEVVNGINIVRHGNQYLSVQFAGFCYYLKNKDKFDFIVDQFHGLPFFTPLFVRKPKLAVIQETAREIWFFNPLPKPLNLLIGLIGYFGEPLVFLIYKNTIFMTGSKSAKDDISKFGIPEKNITIIPHGVVTCKIPSSIKKEKKFTIAFLGVLSRDKGIEDALKCCKLLKEKTKYQFWIIGKSETEEYEKKIKHLVTYLNLKKQIKFWGFVSQRKKFELLKRAHVLVNPSVKEGWGLVNIEANSVSTPVVAYNSGGLVDSVKHDISGLLCQSNTPDNLSKNISELFKNPLKYKKLQNKAYLWSQKFNWKKSSNLSIKLLNKIFNSSL